MDQWFPTASPHKVYYHAVFAIALFKFQKRHGFAGRPRLSSKKGASQKVRTSGLACPVG